ncbi:MAG: SPOR domain-containing protein [Thermaceae bacterium]
MGWLRDNWLDALIFLLVVFVVAGIVLYLTGVNPFARTPQAEGVAAPLSTPLPAAPSADGRGSTGEGATAEPGTSARPQKEAKPEVQAEPVVTVLPLPQAPKEAESRVSAAPKPVARPEPSSPAPSSGVWRVAVGAFADPENALRLSRELSAKGYRVRLEAAGGYTRVVVGPFLKEEEARRAAQALAGYNPQVYRGEGPLPSVYLQVGAFQKEEGALALASKLKEAGLTAVIRKDGLYRVQVGPVSEEEKEALRARLEALGYSPVEVR